MTETVLRVENLVVSYGGRRGKKGSTVIDDVSFDLCAGETLSLVGESGSGKTTIGRAVLGLAPVTSGSVLFRGEAISNISRARRRKIARDIQVVFQDPYSSLNPSMPVEDILVEPLLAAGSRDGRARVRELLDAVGLPADSGGRYPREFSGGQRQRVAIARALALDPSVIICDEPTSALDVTTQARVLTLLQDIQRESGVAYLFISHDLGVVNQVSDRIAVLNQGRIAEIGDAHDIATNPRHPYTRKLQMAAPVADPRRQRVRRAKRLSLVADEGTVVPETTDAH
ncbi:MULTISPECIES: ATP-binding cassette domain-containing protein [Streptomyces]|uniref:ATP-binding cassette domain-containing protein n=1 Tax=Streptomyces griseiscabiei TaxID=2993540 RepID=A0ABU4LCZ8_9ACTN|nr:MULTISPECIES: ATP-binding cassette domain-containing protein [Streptomyces]MBZ3900191.1 ABC transporter ATP-binding protein [Streptomyces griseiscabiei]MDX2913200.1 ATP-binding cassette domain-containing protein [Streptomyces griseiscabiei]